MIYSTDYAELYRRVLNDEEVLCIHNSTMFGDDKSTICMYSEKNNYTWMWFDKWGDKEAFIQHCRDIDLRYVPDNDGLVFAANELVDSIDRFENEHPYHFPNHTLSKYDELKTQLKPYDQ